MPTHALEEWVAWRTIARAHWIHNANNRTIVSNQVMAAIPGSPALADLTLAGALPGDEIDVYFSGYADASTRELWFDAATIVGGSPVTWASTGTGSGALAGITAWTITAANDAGGGLARIAIDADDINGDDEAVVALRGCLSGSPNARDLRGDSARPIQFGATLMRPPA